MPKVAIISSGFFGSLSGSVISNVVTTGKITIPTMKRVGYPPAYAGAVEACASTGGALMPPVMGAVAFLMAENLNMPYADIIMAAAVPNEKHESEDVNLLLREHLHRFITETDFFSELTPGQVMLFLSVSIM